MASRSWGQPIETSSEQHEDGMDSVERIQSGLWIRVSVAASRGESSSPRHARRARLHFSSGGVAMVVSITMMTTAEKMA